MGFINDRYKVNPIGQWGKILIYNGNGVCRSLGARLLWHKSLKQQNAPAFVVITNRNTSWRSKLVKSGVPYICIYFNRDSSPNDLYTITLLIGQSKQYVCFLCQNCVRKITTEKTILKGYWWKYYDFLLTQINTSCLAAIY